MCTAISYLNRQHYFGRNLDLDYSYHESVTITPRKFPLVFRTKQGMNNHFALIGMATVVDQYPLYYDATNESGLSMAGLNFPGNAVYLPPKEGSNNIAPYEFIPWVLCQCRNIAETRNLLQNTNLTDLSFREDFPTTPLHWIVSDRDASIVIEPLAEGIRVYDNPVGVLTNNPPFEYHMYNLINYLNLTREVPENRFASQIDLTTYSNGMGAIGLPGDLSSASRFVRAAFTKLNSVAEEDENSSVSQFFHILGTVAQQRGCVKVNGNYEKTVYTSCCNTDTGVYYYSTYENNRITGVNLFHENLDASDLRSFPLALKQEIRMEN